MNISLDRPKIMQRKTYKKDSIIFSQNENSNEIYILNNGILEILINQHKIAEISQRGVFFGEMAFVLNEKRNATVKTKTDCSCIVIYSQYVNSVINSNPVIGINLMKSLANRLKKTTQGLLKSIKKQNKNSIFTNPYSLMIAFNMINQKKVEKSIEFFKVQNQKKPLTECLSEVANLDIKDINTVFNLFKKYNQ